jgi:uncharacterized protein YaaQ
MKLVIAIIRSIDGGPAIDALVGKGYRVTRVASTGGFLRRGNVTLLVGVEDAEVEAVIDTLRQSCSPPDPSRGVVFVVDAPYFEQI